MATTNTSGKACTHFRLKLKDLDSNQSFDLNLYQGSAARGELSIDGSAIVYSSRRYSVVLFANKEIAPTHGFFDINYEAEESVVFTPSKETLNESDGDEWHSYQLVFDRGGPDRDEPHLFRAVFGLAKIRLEIEGQDGSVSLETFDLPCACDTEDYRHAVSDMLDELIDTEDRQCIDWMFSPVKFEQEKASMIESALVENNSKSFKSLAELARKTLKVYKRRLDYFILHGHCRTVGKEALVNPSSVKKLGRNELVWLVQNPGQLYESTRKTALCRSGRYYMANRIQTQRHHKSYDNLENRSLVAFAGEICHVLARAISDVEKHVAQFQEIRNNLEKVNDNANDVLLPTLVLIDIYLDRENPIIDEAKNIQEEFRGIRERLRKSLPDVSEIQYVLPRRTKVFQEVVPYAEIHAEMRKWNDFGHVDTVRDTLALRTWRIDKLYEYYVLFRLLQFFRDLGFHPKDGAEQVEYSLEGEDTVFHNVDQVANKYMLNRGNEQITLYYQPVFYGDEREEHEIRLHRTTCGRKHPYWTPDYLIVHRCDRKVSNTVIDAKFRPLNHIQWWADASFDGSENGSDSKGSAFLDCVLKYKMATCGSGGARVDAMWILYGRRAKSRVYVYQYSEWAKKNYNGLLDGIAPLSPEVDCIAEMMEKVGIGEQSAV